MLLSSFSSQKRDAGRWKCVVVSSGTTTNTLSFVEFPLSLLRCCIEPSVIRSQCPMKPNNSYTNNLVYSLIENEPTGNLPWTCLIYLIQKMAVASITSNVRTMQSWSTWFLTAIIICKRHEFGDIMAVLNNKKCSRLVGVGLTRIYYSVCYYCNVFGLVFHHYQATLWYIPCKLLCSRWCQFAMLHIWSIAVAQWYRFFRFHLV